MSRASRSRRVKIRSARPRFGRLALVGVVAFAILLLLLRMLTFVHGHGRRGF